MNSDEKNICKEGIVRGINGDNVIVEIIVSSACSGCHAKSICIPSDHRKDTVIAKNLTGENFQIGETVNIMLQNTAGAKAVIIAYVIPLIILLLVLFSCYFITKNELLSVGIAFLSVILYYLFIKKINSKIEKEIEFFVRKQQ